MALSDYEQRILHEIEIELRRPRHPRAARCHEVLRTRWPVLTACVLAVAVIVLLAVFATSSAAAVPAAVVGAAAGYTIATNQLRRR